MTVARFGDAGAFLRHAGPHLRADAIANNLEALPRRAADKLMPAYSERLIWRAEENDRFIELSKRAGPQAYGPKSRE